MMDQPRSPEEALMAAGATITRVVPQLVVLNGKEVENVTEQWPDPIDFLSDGEMTGVPELLREHVPAALYDFISDTAERMGVDPAAVALASFVSCASVATDDWRIQPKQYDDTWTESPRLWGAIVGDPSILKSPVIAACTRPIDGLEMAARERHDAEMRIFRIKEAEWKKAAKKGDNEGEAPRPPLLDRYLVEGTTVEALSEVLRTDDQARMNTPAHKVLVRQDEMSEWIGGMDKYKSGGGGGGSDRGAYLRLYNGGRYTVDRVLRGSFSVPNWSACFLGGIQPGPIQKIASNAEEDGLLQRFMYCVPGRQDLGVDRKPDHNARRRYEALITALTALTPGIDQTADKASHVTLSAEAHAYRERMNKLARVMAAMPDTSSRLKAAYGKWPGLFARILLTFHLINLADARAQGSGRPHSMVISGETAAMAAAYMEAIVLPHLQRADAIMFATKQTGHARWIAGWILAQAQPRVAKRDITRAYGDLRAPELNQTLMAVMDTLVMLGWLVPEEPSNPARPIAAWQVNPKVGLLFAARGEAERARRKAAQAEMAELIKGRK
jgi:hypothetical protein